MNERNGVVLVSLMILLAIFSMGEAATTDNVLQKTLQNGLTVVVKEYPNAPVVSLRMYVKVGSVYEEEFLGCGMSHYCEHLVAGGTTPARIEAESKELLREIGAQTNAYTTRDHTCYYIDCSSSEWDRGLELLSDWVMNCSMDSMEIAREKGVILREINMGEDEPGRVMYKLFMKTMFPNSPQGIPTIGFRENFARISPEEITGFQKKYYIPNNSFVTIVGDVDADTALARVEELMGGWERKPLFRKTLPKEPEQTARRFANEYWPGSVAYLRMGWPTVHLTHPDLYALDLLAAILGTGRTSILSRRIKDDLGLAHQIGAYSLTPHYGPGPFTVFATVPGDGAREVMDAVLSEIERIKTSLISDEEIERAKTQVIASFSFQRQACDELAGSMGRDLVGTWDPHFSDRYAERIGAVTAEEMRTVAQTYLRSERMTVACLGPEPLSDDESINEVEAEAQGNVVKTVLPNGLRVLTKSNGNVDVVSIYATFLGGNRYEDAETNGLFALMARCITRGTKDHDADGLASLVESRGGSITSGSGKDFFWVQLNLLAEDLDLGMDLMGQLLTEARFDQDEIERQKEILIADIQNRENDWQSEAFDFYLSSFFKDHPYGLHSMGDPSVITQLSRQALIETYENFIRGETGVVAVFGAVNPDDVSDEAQSHLNHVSAGHCPEARESILADHSESTRAIKPNEKGQVTITLGYPAPPAGDANEHAMRLVDAITSGVRLPRGWLHEALRGRNDLVYFIHLVPIMYKDAGTVVVITQCQPDLADSVLGLIEIEMERARNGEFSPEELTWATSECITATNLSQQRMDDQAARFARYELLGFGIEEALSTDDRYRAVSLDDLKIVAGTHLSDGFLAMTGPFDDQSIMEP